MAVDQGEELLAAEHYEKDYFYSLYSFENQAKPTYEEPPLAEVVRGGFCDGYL